MQCSRAAPSNKVSYQLFFGALRPVLLSACPVQLGQRLSFSITAAATQVWCATEQHSLAVPYTQLVRDKNTVMTSKKQRVIEIICSIFANCALPRKLGFLARCQRGNHQEAHLCFKSSAGL